MITPGKLNALEILNVSDKEIIFDGKEHGPLSCFGKNLTEKYNVGEKLKVFVYLDNNQAVATLASPKIELHQCAYLKCADVNKFGAFFDWGMPKELLVPYAEQPYKVFPGLYYSIYLYSDKASKRLVGSLRLSKFLSEKNTDFKVNQEVDLLICGKSKLGFKAVINQTHLGLIHHSEVFKPIKLGQQLKGFIKQIRDDGKINIGFVLPDSQKLDDLAQRILDDLKENQGVSHMTDKTPPQEIYNKWNVSKASYKRALGTLYKKKLIEISKETIRLAKT